MAFRSYVLTNDKPGIVYCKATLLAKNLPAEPPNYNFLRTISLMRPSPFGRGLYCLDILLCNSDSHMLLAADPICSRYRLR